MVGCRAKERRQTACRSRRFCGRRKCGASPARGPSEGNFGGEESKAKFSTHSFGAHFVEVAWQPEIVRLRVNRVLTVIDAGRILNPLAGRNQIEGAVVMGIGMALFEETQYEPRTGAPINSNLADYIVAVNADVPKLEVIFLDYPDLQLNELGARGIGEIGLAGIGRRHHRAPCTMPPGCACAHCRSRSKTCSARLRSRDEISAADHRSAFAKTATKPGRWRRWSRRAAPLIASPKSIVASQFAAACPRDAGEGALLEADIVRLVQAGDLQAYELAISVPARSCAYELPRCGDAGDKLAALAGQRAEITFDLQAVPKPFGLSKEFAESDRHGWRDGAFSEDNFVDGTRGHTDGSGHGVL